MNLLKLINSLFKRKETNPYKLAKKTIKKMGYKNQGDGTFVRESSYGHTIIRFIHDGVHIKAYGGGYAESEFYNGPLTDIDALKQFIRRNQL